MANARRHRFAGVQSLRQRLNSVAADVNAGDVPEQRLAGEDLAQATGKSARGMLGDFLR
ncbi:MAG: hypothetical protein HZT41_08500 [Dechloromonas sp.]|nr:MAG: hypothetical protein HZT41_08500 [Dechloromonas sp.]